MQLFENKTQLTAAATVLVVGVAFAAAVHYVVPGGWEDARKNAQQQKTQRGPQKPVSSYGFGSE